MAKDKNKNILNNVIMRYKSAAKTPLQKVQEYFKSKCVEYEKVGEDDAFKVEYLEDNTGKMKLIKSEAENVCKEAILEYNKKINERKSDITKYESNGYMTSKRNAEVDIANYEMEKEYVNTQYLQPLDNPDADIYVAYKRGFENGLMKNAILKK